MFNVLLTHFATIILPTYRSRHTQFLLFHFAQTSPWLIDRFAGTCVHFAFDQGRPAILKQSCAAYLASFVARGAHVPASVVKDTFRLIGAQLDAIRADHESSCVGPDIRRFGTFYAMVQALLYIFCFRWRDLVASSEEFELDGDLSVEDGKDLVWSPEIKETLTRSIYSKFNPIKVCSQGIVHEFARIANHLHFIYVFPLLETNKRLRLTAASASTPNTSSSTYNQPARETALTARKDESLHQLDAYFPFDPYNLPISKRWVHGDYVEWRAIPGLDDKLEEDTDSDGGDDIDAEDHGMSESEDASD